MHEFERHATEEFVRRRGTLTTRGRRRRQHGANALATSIDEVGGDRVEILVANFHGREQDGFKSLEVVSQLGQAQFSVDIHVFTLRERRDFDDRDRGEYPSQRVSRVNLPPDIY